MLSLLLLTSALLPSGVSDADIAVLIHQSLTSDARASTSADALGRATNRRPDAAVARDVLSVLRVRLGTKLGSLSVSCVEGTVRLRGTAVNSEAVEKAASITASVSGARKVDNQLRAAGDDSEAEAAAAEVEVPEEPVVGPFDFLTRDGLAGAHVVVSVEAGVVQIHGKASSIGARDYATSAARLVPGARLVKNLMEVRPVSSTEDARLMKLIRRQMEWSGTLRSVLSRISVSVKDGVARVEGSGLTAAQAKEAARVARATVGVLLVDDRLKRLP
ncbi:MAG: hypothetical protein DHS20C15_23540 [Planctomycetota bacterium]|nr:MAG: hypothetical protein DHS20C15_23540 [Planctomycetota bacterium]